MRGAAGAVVLLREFRRIAAELKATREQIARALGG